jgi:hypothetical protein
VRCRVPAPVDAQAWSRVGSSVVASQLAEEFVHVLAVEPVDCLLRQLAGTLRSRGVEERCSSFGRQHVAGDRNGPPRVER